MPNNILKIGIGKRNWSLIVAFLMLAAVFPVISGEASADRGGSCAYGYEWTDSQLPLPTVDYNWIEISATGTDTGITGDDNYGGPYPIGFNFNYFGNTYSEFYVSTNGIITFGSGSTTWTNQDIPSTTNPNNLLAAYWDDLCVDWLGYNTGIIYYETVGSAPNQQLVVEWWEISRRLYSNLMTFEAILNETGEIWFQYQSLSGETGASATVGIEDDAGTDACAYSYNTNSLSDMLAIRFTLPEVQILPDQSTYALPGTDASYTLTVTNNQPFPDSFDLTNVTTLGWSVTLYDSTGSTPLTDTNGDFNGYPDTGNIPAYSSVNIVVNISVPPSPISSPEVTNITATSFTNNSISDTAQLTTYVSSQFAPPHGDRGSDTDSDGLFEWLVIEVEVNASVAGTYTVTGNLYDSTFTTWIAWASNTTLLSAGIQTVEIQFDGTQINTSGFDGPYVFSILLYDQFWMVLDTNTNNTAAYTADQFQFLAILDPPHSDYGLNIDADIYYEYLVVEANVNASVAGNYQVDADLYDAALNLITSDSNLSFLNIGMNVVELWFNGITISLNGSDGPYRVELVLSDLTPRVLDNGSHWTAAYLNSDFQPVPPAFIPPWTDDFEFGQLGGNYTINWTASDINYAGVNMMTSQSGSYSMYTMGGAVTVTSWPINLSSLSSAELTVWIQRGSDAFSEDPDGGEDLVVEYRNVTGSWNTLETFLGSGTAGQTYNRAYLLPADALGSTFQIRFRQLSGSGMGMDYWHIDDIYVGVPMALFAPPHSDYGSDPDIDGMYEWLVVDVELDIAVAGTYSVMADLYDGTLTTWISSDSNTTALSVGLQTVTIQFDGIDINRSGFDGPYMVVLDLYDQLWTLRDSDTHTTAAYLASDFQFSALLQPPHGDYGSDTDSDGLFDWLVIDVDANVGIAGTYTVFINLFDSTFTTWITSSMNTTALSTGLQTISVELDGTQINRSGFDGPYIAYIELYDQFWVLQDTDTHTTAAYLASDFQFSGLFQPPHSDYGYDPDSDGMFEWLIVEVDVNIGTAGTYSVVANLYDGTFTAWISSDINTTALSSGFQTIEIWLDGVQINQSGFDGPYIVDLDLYDQFWALQDSDTHTTSGYLASDFQFLALFQPPHSDYGYDPDSDGMFEWLIVDVDVNIGTAGTYSVVANLYDGTFTTWIGSDVNTTALSAGLQTVEIWLYGIQINQSGFDGPYIVDLDLYDQFWVLQDSETHTTSPFLASDFQFTGQFQPPHNDYGIDSDSDGTFDYLIVEAFVDVLANSIFQINATLYDSFMTQLGSSLVNNTALTVGVNAVEFQFNGEIINANGVNGPYQVDLVLRHASIGIMDTDTHWTAAYLSNDFDTPVRLVAPLYDDFESGLFGGSTGYNWSTTSGSLSGVSADTSNSGVYSMYTMGGAVSVTSWYINLSGLAEAEVRYWVQRGDDSFSEDPDLGEDLILEYYTNTSIWLGLRTFTGAGISGEIMIGNVSLPADALHSDFRLRFRQTSGSGIGTDYWHIDDVYVGSPLTLATLYPPYSESAVDADSDGLYNWLIISVPVNVTDAGYYGIEGILRDNTSTIVICSTTSWAYLTPGIQTVDVSFEGGYINMSGIDGPYNVSIGLIHGIWGVLENDTYVTAAYLANEFNELNIPPVAEFRISPTSGTTSTLFQFNPFDTNDTEDPDSLLEMRWDWENDGVWDTSWATLDNVTHTFAIPGQYFIALQVRDTGNLSDQVVHSLNVTEEPPVTTATPSGTEGANGWYISDVSVVLSATDDASGVNYTRYRIGSGSWLDYSTAISLDQDGEFTIYYYSVDYANYTETTKSLEIKIDTVAPTLEIDQQNNTVFTEDSIIISWTASDATSGIDRYEISVNGGNTQTINAGTTSVDLTGLSAGDHYLIVRAIDNAGLVTEDRIDFSVEEETGGGTTITDFLPWLIIIIIIAAAVILLIFFLAKRKKKGPADEQILSQVPPPPQDLTQ